ncbi:MAG: DUF342 domain-containing protein [Phycisphaerales bacterium]|nr:MAG: DUF342 domain-containing protein [Phycisphaerales bacterium]
MSAEGTQVTPVVSIVIDSDHLRAWLEPAGGVKPSDLDASVIRAELEKAKVAIDDQVEARIRTFVQEMVSGGVLERVLLAQGTAPVAAEDGRFELAEGLARKPKDEPDKGEAQEGDSGPLDYRDRETIRTVEADTVIGKIIAPHPGKPGIDVHGNELKPKGSGRGALLGENVRLDEDGETVWSTVAGRVAYRNGKVQVDDVLEITGDVDFAIGNVAATSHVHIHGTVRDLFKVYGKKSVVVDGAVEAADVRAEDCLAVGGGILGRSKGKVRVANEVSAKFCVEADIRAGGDVRIDKEIINSKVFTDGRLLVERGSIIGGDLYGRRGIVVKTLGSESAVPTVLRVGASLEVLRKAREIEGANKKRLKAAEYIRQRVQPLLDNVKRLSAAQKERATELLFQAESIETEIEESRCELERMLGEGCPSEGVFVLIHAQVWQRVSVAIGDRVATLKTEMKGPLRIELRKINNVTEFAAVDQLSGSVAKLPCRRLRIVLQGKGDGDNGGS